MAAVKLVGVEKKYDLSKRGKKSLLEALGLKTPKQQSDSFKYALKNVDIEISKGERVGVIGRNGSGKTTLLKLLTGNFAPTQGSITINGTVQALMNMGGGFHPENTGYENIISSLSFNGLNKDELKHAVDDIILFCELGEYLHQPVKSYSLGMQARLMFACATAIKPDILIVDEILGAGDAYFIAKSRIRMDALIKSGCTLILVSHSIAQILEMCDRVIWINDGKVMNDGPAFQVVKEYEAFVCEPIKRLSGVSVSESNDDEEEVLPEEQEGEADVTELKALRQVPQVLPEASVKTLPDSEFVPLLNHPLAAPGGVSRWGTPDLLEIIGFSTMSPLGANAGFVSLKPAAFSIFIEYKSSEILSCRCGIVLHDHLGNELIRSFSVVERLRAAGTYRFDVHLNPLQIGKGCYTIGVSLHGGGEIEVINFTDRYDLLSRSFIVDVEEEESLTPLSARFYHTLDWRLSNT